AIYLTVLLKCFLVRTLLVSNISRFHKVENREDHMTLSFLTTLLHLSYLPHTPFTRSIARREKSVCKLSIPR
ncbi:hypothetical protein LINPERPRIM_LOCUS27066, partial [Linum perenne]